MRLRILASTMLVFALTACGGGSGSDSDEPADDQTSAAASTPPLSKTQATKALLTLDDLSDGWSVDPDDDSGDDVKVTKGSEACKEMADGADDEAPIKVESSFTSNDEAFLSSEVESYDSSQAKKEWDADLKAISTCHSFTLGDADGFTIDLLVEPTTIAELGDDSAAFHATGTVQGVTLHLEILGVRAGRNVAGITSMSFGDRVPMYELETMMKTVLERLDQLDDAA